MTIVRWSGFGGENQAIPAKQLAEGLGTRSRNQKPLRGALRPWRQPVTVASVPAGRQTIYRMGRDVASDANYWLSWPGVVHAVRGFDEADTTERTFYTGDGTPKVTDNIMALSSAPYPTTSRPLGIPAPATAPTVSKDSGSWTGDVATYFYIYTYVNDWGWESAPSPPSLQLDRETDATATITSFAAVPAGNYQVNRIRIYRTQTGSSGATEFFFLREIAIGTASTVDDNRELGESLITTTWLSAPSDLSFLTPMWNGMLAGISGNGVRFCEAYVPYAWPVAYDVLPPDSKAVALGVFGQQLLVLTTGRPLLVAGSSPDSLDQMPLEFSQACIAPRSTVSMGVGVAWASNDGLCFYGTGGPRLLTAGVLERDQWQALRPASIIGKFYEGLYFGTYEPVIGQPRKAFVIDPGNPAGMYFLDVGYPALHFDELQDQLYVLDGTNVKRWDAGAPMTASATSKEFVLPVATTMTAAEVVADAYPMTARFIAKDVEPAAVTAMLAKAVPGLDSPAARTLRYSKTVDSRKPFRLPAMKAKDWQIEADTTGVVQGAAVASMMDELKFT